jgi:hypothetical protein
MKGRKRKNSLNNKCNVKSKQIALAQHTKQTKPRKFETCKTKTKEYKNLHKSNKRVNETTKN